jgi:transcription-repair coupling factor (superfamily II helicase)
MSATFLALQSILLAAAQRSGLTRDVHHVTGLDGAARALAVAATAVRVRPRPTLVIMPTDAAIDTMVDDARFLLSALEGLSTDAAERVVLPLPSLQVDPYRGLAPHFRAASSRAQALHALASGQARIVVASAAALLPRVAPPIALRSLSTTLKPGLDYSPDDLVQMLIDGGYQRQDPVDEHGEYCLRGGILDIFGAGEAQPIRLEFAGDTIESIRRVDAATQRSIESLDQYTVVPVRDFSGHDVDTAELPTSSLFDYLAHATLLVVEADDVRDQMVQAWERVQSSYRDLSEGERDRRPAPGALLIEPSQVEARWPQAIRLDALALDDASTGALHVPSQPTPEFKGRIPQWVADLRDARDRGDTVVFVAGARGRAERAVELLRDYDIRAVWSGAPTGVAATGAVIVVDGHLSRGFRLPAVQLQVYAETDVFDEARHRQQGRGPQRSASAAFLSDLRDLKVGDLIVHVDHGIGSSA